MKSYLIAAVATVTLLTSAGAQEATPAGVAEHATAPKLTELLGTNENEYVFAVQRALSALGVEGVPQDGLLTRATIKAIGQFCLQQSIAETCKVGLLTEEAAVAIGQAFDALTIESSIDAGSSSNVPVVETVVAPPTSISAAAWIVSTNGGNGTTEVDPDGTIRLAGDGTKRAEAFQIVQLDIGSVCDLSFKVEGSPVEVLVGSSPRTGDILGGARSAGEHTFKVTATTSTTSFLVRKRADAPTAVSNLRCEPVAN